MTRTNPEWNGQKAVVIESRVRTGRDRVEQKKTSKLFEIDH